MKVSAKVKKSILVAALLTVMMFAMTLTANARKLTTKVHANPKSTGYVEQTLNKAEYIKVTSAKGLKYKISYENWSTENYKSNTSSTADIRFYAAKTGTYTIKYDIYSAVTDKKVASGSTKVYVRADGPIKKVTVNGKPFEEFGYLTTAKTIKFKVTMNKGYKLKKLEYGIYTAPKTTTDASDYSKTTRANNEMTYKTFKNGGKVKLGSQGYYYLYNYEYLDKYGDGKEAYKSHHMNSELPRTEIRITYIDKYTKQATTTSYGFSRW